MTTEDIASAILRFRDLNLPEGETISRHREIAQDSDSVWWGWWAQQNERIADEAMRLLETRVHEGINLLLFDSGGRRLYRARCVEIMWDRTAEPIATPDPGRTPDYYVGRKCRAWFRFEEIADEPLGSLAAWSYVHVPELFSDLGETFESFDSKQVSSADELFLQRRTLWFVRPFQEGDGIREIRLEGGVGPQDFTESFIESRSDTLIWLSDLHFATDDHHAFPLQPSPSGDRLPLADALIRELQVLRPDRPVAGLVITGDLTWRAEPEEFRLASDAIRRISSWAALDSNHLRVAVAPGNHDVRFSETPEDDRAPVTLAPTEAKAAFSQFYKDTFFRTPNEYLSSGRRFLMGRSVPVEIAVLNSSMLDQVPQRNVDADQPIVRFQGQGFVGDAQLEDAAKQMKWAEPRPGRVVRIAALHHHLVPVSYSEPAKLGGNYSVTLDSGRLMDWIVRHRVDVVLHGHQHEPFLARLSRPILEGPEVVGWHRFYIVGMGSSGVAGTLPPDVPNVFSLLQFSGSALDVRMYSLDATVRSQPLWHARLDLE